MYPQKFGGVPYSMEELVAEMGASFLCSSVQIDYDNVIENNTAYLVGWLKVLKEDSNFTVSYTHLTLPTSDLV